MEQHWLPAERDSVGTVSYTHLDVYKRQVMTNLYILCNRNDSVAQAARAVSVPSMGKSSTVWQVKGSQENRMADSFGVRMKNAYGKNVKLRPRSVRSPWLWEARGCLRAGGHF